MVLALTASACVTWRVEKDPLPAPLDGRTLPEIRIVTRARDTLIVYDARIAGDTIIGLSRPRGDAGAERVTIGTDAVAQVAYRDGTIWKTLWTATATIALAVALVTLAAAVVCAAAISAG
jgi:hypothetical protein